MSELSEPRMMRIVDELAEELGAVGDLGSAEPVGVTLTVPPLVVPADPDDLHGLENFGRDIAAEGGVALELLVLLGSQRRGLGEDRVGDPDLADIVEEAG